MPPDDRKTQTSHGKSQKQNDELTDKQLDKVTGGLGDIQGDKHKDTIYIGS